MTTELDAGARGRHCHACGIAPRDSDHGRVPAGLRGEWAAIGAPKNTPAHIVEGLNKAINAALADLKIKARIADLGATALSGSLADRGKLIAGETEK
jgi:Tripartite tricarboxylate transporter family receptor